MAIMICSSNAHPLKKFSTTKCLENASREMATLKMEHILFSISIKNTWKMKIVSNWKLYFLIPSWIWIVPQQLFFNINYYWKSVIKIYRKYFLLIIVSNKLGLRMIDSFLWRLLQRPCEWLSVSGPTVIPSRKAK